MKLAAHISKRVWLLLGLSLSLVITALAQKSPAVKTIELPDDNAMAKLKPGPGADTTEVNCMGCHSTDYLVRQPGGDAEHWQSEVKKMIKVFGASISDEDAQAIVKYLSSAYGPAPATTPTSKTRGLAGESKLKSPRPARRAPPQ